MNHADKQKDDDDQEDSASYTNKKVSSGTSSKSLTQYDADVSDQTQDNKSHSEELEEYTLPPKRVIMLKTVMNRSIFHLQIIHLGASHSQFFELV